MVAGSAVGRGCAFGARVIGGCVFAVDITMAGGDWSTISDGTKQGIASGPMHVKPTKHKMTRPGEIPGSLADCSTAWLALSGRLKNENQDENLQEAIKTQKSKNEDVQ